MPPPSSATWSASSRSEGAHRRGERTWRQSQLEHREARIRTIQEQPCAWDVTFPQEAQTVAWCSSSFKRCPTLSAVVAITTFRRSASSFRVRSVQPASDSGSNPTRERFHTRQGPAAQPLGRAVPPLVFVAKGSRCERHNVDLACQTAFDRSRSAWLMWASRIGATATRETRGPVGRRPGYGPSRRSNVER